MSVPGAGSRPPPSVALSLLLLAVVAVSGCLAEAADVEQVPLTERHVHRWQWLDLWPRLLDIRRQFDRDGFPRDNEAAGTTQGGPRNGVPRTLELDIDGEHGGRRAAATRLQDSTAPSPRDEAVASTLGPLITPIANPKLSEACFTDTTQYIFNILNEPWALHMFDATGKLPDGMLLGNINPWGNWDECLNTTAHYSTTNNFTGKTTEHSFSGKYCMTFLSPIDDKEHIKASPYSQKAGLGLAPLLPALGGNTASVGVCIPSSCSAEELVIGLNIALIPQGVSAFTDDTLCYTQDDKTEISPEAIVMITILSVVVFCMLTGTIIDVLMTKFAGWRLSTLIERRLPLLLRKTLTAFSVYTNGRKLLDTSSTKDTLSCLHGIRFFSMTWVILGHTYFFTVFFKHQNLIKVYSYYGDWLFETIGNATVSVDSFFFLSGLLVAYIAMRNIERANGKLNIVMYYVHRYIRLTPVMMAVIGCVATLEEYVGSGPWWKFASLGDSGVQVCRENWWKNMLYINNLVDMDRQCIGQTWYLANDMQMFLFSPLVLLPLYHWPVLGQLWIIFLICFFTGINAMITVIHKLTYSGSLPDGDDLNLRYMKPWTRAGPYLVGLYMGWVLHKIRGRKIVLPAPVVAIGWLAASMTGCLIIYGIFGQPTSPPEATNVIYAMLNRTAWSVALAWVVFACVTGYGGVVNSLLSWKALIPLSRLTYTSYLVSIDMQVIYWLGNKAPQYLDHTVLVYQFLGSLPVIFAVATMFSLAFESPMLALEKLIFPQPSRAAAPAAGASKTPVPDGVPPKAAEPVTIGEHENVNQAFEDDGGASPASEESSKTPLVEVGAAEETELKS